MAREKPLQQRIRPRRNRKSEPLRQLVAETALNVASLVAPLFVVEGKDKMEEIPSMPGQFRLSIDLLLKKASTLYRKGIRCVALFPVLEDKLKDPYARESANPAGLYPRAIVALKEHLPDLLVMSDVAMDPYSSKGHDGLVDEKSGKILNDPTLEILGAMAIVQARAGSDLIGPSDMMDGRVGFLRDLLDGEGFTETSIISYCAKYASSFYGPFRDALDSAPKKGNKKTYQMDPANAREALLEAKLDQEEGADILMVKPALAYLDVIASISQHTSLPLAAYSVSGEYAMIKAAAQKGWIEEDRAILEMLMAFKRAKADIIITYFAERVAELLP